MELDKDFSVEKDSIIGKPINPNEKTENNENDFIDVFSFENIIQEYSFATGDTSLYLEQENNRCELLYESSCINGIQNSSFYTKDSVFILTNYDVKNHYVTGLDHIHKKNFIEFCNKYDKKSRTKIGTNVNDMSATIYMMKNSTRLVQNNKNYYEQDCKDLWNAYKKIYIRYTAASNLIPASNIIDGCISDIHKYISTGSLDISSLTRRLNELQNFKDICTSTISLLAAFISDPNKADLQHLCNSLERNSQNVDNLLRMYLEDELNINKENEK